MYNILYLYNFKKVIRHWDQDSSVKVFRPREGLSGYAQQIHWITASTDKKLSFQAASAPKEQLSKKCCLDLQPI